MMTLIPDRVSADGGGGAQPASPGVPALPAMAQRSATAGTVHPAPVVNEPIRTYPAGSAAARGLSECLDELYGERFGLPLVIGGARVRTGRTFDDVLPHEHRHVLATVQSAGPTEVRDAIDAALEASRSWSLTPAEERFGVFLRAANLAAGTWRNRLVAATMLGQSKTVAEAEGDVAELVDFFRFNVAGMLRMYEEQPASTPEAFNRMDYRALEGFVLAVTPFNFTSIAGNLPCAPALLGNTVLWKPASSATLPAYFVMCLLEEAGLPAGVVNLLFGRGGEVASVAVTDPDLAGIHFTGSTAVFQQLWSDVGTNIARYRTYPRLVGETGGKDFVVVHPSADMSRVVPAVIQGAFGYQGQKCSAVSRLYVPESAWPSLREALVAAIERLTVGDVRDFGTDLGAVIDRAALERQQAAIADARAQPDTGVVAGGTTESELGWFVHPTLIETTDPDSRLLSEELFGPVLTAYCYRDGDWEAALSLVDRTSPYGLTGAVFATDREAVAQATVQLRHAAGNFYVNDKPTGAFVGQQPFGGARASGTDDKAGSVWNLIRWASPRSIKDRLT